MFDFFLSPRASWLISSLTTYLTLPTSNQLLHSSFLPFGFVLDTRPSVLFGVYDLLLPHALTHSLTCMRVVVTVAPTTPFGWRRAVVGGGGDGSF